MGLFPSKDGKKENFENHEKIVKIDLYNESDTRSKLSL
jgi:hypothetical protein